MFLPVSAHCLHSIMRTCNICERGRASSVIHIKLDAPAVLSLPHIVREIHLRSEWRGYSRTEYALCNNVIGAYGPR